MAGNVDLRTMELLCSRLCHDLVGPIGAINNGLELLSDYDPSMADDVIPLLTSSAKQAWGRLEFFRAALGFGGGRSTWRSTDLKRLAQGMLQSDKVVLDWAVPDALDIERMAAQVLLNLFLVGVETLPRGGTVSIRLVETGGRPRLAVDAKGEGAVLADRHRIGLAADETPGELDARGVHAYVTRIMADAAGAKIAMASEPGKISFEAILQKA